MFASRIALVLVLASSVRADTPFDTETQQIDTMQAAIASRVQIIDALRVRSLKDSISTR
jgi:hypothetical protein